MKEGLERPHNLFSDTADLVAWTRSPEADQYPDARESFREALITLPRIYAGLLATLGITLFAEFKFIPPGEVGNWLRFSTIGLTFVTPITGGIRILNKLLQAENVLVRPARETLSGFEEKNYLQSPY